MKSGLVEFSVFVLIWCAEFAFPTFQTKKMIKTEPTY